MSKGDQRSYEKAIQTHHKLILEGWVLAVDQATGLGDSDPGWALFHQGELEDSGTLDIKAKNLPEALKQVQTQLQTLNLHEADFLVIEAHRGRLVHPHLHFASGAILAGIDCWAWTKIPVTHWKKLARTDENYKKGDEEDAIIFGRCVVADARRARAGDTPKPKPRRTRKRTRSKATKRRR